VIDLTAMKAARERAAAEQDESAARPRRTRHAAQEAAGQLTLSLVPPGDRGGPGGAAAAPGTKYSVILADPAWKLNNQGTRIAPAYAGAQREDARYEVMGNEAIFAMGSWVQSISEDDAILVLWVINNLILDGVGQACARAWGFEPKQLIPWTKVSQSTGEPRFGGGNYTRVCSEQMILATRGRATKLIADKGVAGAFLEPGGITGSFVELRGNEHSRKPDSQYELVERLVGPHVRKAELFGRRAREGYDVYGDQAPIKAKF
jgi:N6-adenosine-specific RNA methylase IME4